MVKFLLGLGLGVAAGLLIAPRPGVETRRELLDRAEELKEMPRQKMAEVIELGRQRAGEAAREATQNAYDQAAEKVVGKDIVDRSRQA